MAKSPTDVDEELKVTKEIHSIFKRDEQQQFDKRTVLMVISNYAYFLYQNTGLSHEEIVSRMRERGWSNEIAEDGLKEFYALAPDLEAAATGSFMAGPNPDRSTLDDGNLRYGNILVTFSAGNMIKAEMFESPGNWIDKTDELRSLGKS